MEKLKNQRWIEYRRIYPIEFNFENKDMRTAVSGHRLMGYASVFDQETEIAGLYREVIRRGAFKKTLRESDQVALWAHDTAMPLARKSMGTLDLREAKDGLAFNLQLGEQEMDRMVLDRVARGLVQKMSFGFSVVKDTWALGEGKNLDLREILEVRLFEISPVVFPAYEGTSVEIKGEKIAESILESARNDGRLAGSLHTDLTLEPGADDHSDFDAEKSEPGTDDHSGAEGRWRLAMRRRRLEIAESLF